MNVYKTKGTCSTQIFFDVTDDGKVTGVKFIGGCRGNLQAVARLSEGKTPEELIPLLKGIQCRGGTSCGDQFAQALEKYVEEHKKV